MEIIAGRALVSDRGTQCTIGTTAVDAAGAAHVITAGHAKGTDWHWHGGWLGITSARLFRPLDTLSIGVIHGTPTALVDRFDGSFVELTGFATAEPGLRVVRVGAKSRWTPGHVTHVGQDQHYDLGRPITGLIRTDILSARGDSGGPVITEPVNGTAQLVGFTSGGWISRRRGNVTFAQPAETAFEALALRPQWKIRERCAL
jgi:hypothetical protein